MSEPSTLASAREQSPDEPGAAAPSRTARIGAGLRRALLSPDAAAVAAYLLLAVWVTRRFWSDPAGRGPETFQGDWSLMQWFLGHSVRFLTHFEDPFITHRMNVPDGVNLMGNTPFLGLAVPISPITYLFGPAVAAILLITLGLAGTATAWYFVLSRHVVKSRFAAAVGAGFCGFAPAMISHATWHPNIISQFVVPLIAWRTIKLREPGRSLRNGVVLGLLVAYQVFINEEILLFAALTVGAFCILYALQRRSEIRGQVKPFIAGLGFTALTASALLAYPLYIQFFGPQSYHGLGEVVENFGVDVFSYVTYASESLAGNAAANVGLAPNLAEESTFFGWPLVILVIAIVAWQWRSAAIRTLGVIMAGYVLLSFGERISFKREPVGVYGPWWWMRELPLLDAIVTTRFGLVVSALVGVLLAMGTQKVLEAGRTAPVVRRVWMVALIGALVPIAPTPLTATTARPVPQFITQGSWKAYVADDQALVPVPLPDWRGGTESIDSLRWAASQNLGFALPSGYFLAPVDGVRGNRAEFGVKPRPTTDRLREVGRDGAVPPVTEAMRADLRADIEHWNAAAFVLFEQQANAAALKTFLDQLIGPGKRVDDVWVWDVRAIS